MWSSSVRSAAPEVLVGKGKIEEIAMGCRRLGADLLVFDEELTPSQLNSISSLTGLKVIDPNQLILDIFAARAKTNEAKIQVELRSSVTSCPGLRRKRPPCPGSRRHWRQRPRRDEAGDNEKRQK